jgi:hypothetical protein
VGSGARLAGSGARSGTVDRLGSKVESAGPRVSAASEARLGAERKLTEQATVLSWLPSPVHAKPGHSSLASRAACLPGLARSCSSR